MCYVYALLQLPYSSISSFVKIRGGPALSVEETNVPPQKKLQKFASNIYFFKICPSKFFFCPPIILSSPKGQAKYLQAAVLYLHSARPLEFYA